NYTISRLEHARALPLIIGVFSLLPLIGFFVGGVPMIVFVALGLTLANRLTVDPSIALGMSLRPLYIAFSVSPSGMANIGQIVYPEVTLYSGYGGRAIMYTVFLLVTLLYVIWYARRVIKSPNKSLMNTTSWQQNNVQTTNTEIDLKD